MYNKNQILYLNYFLGLNTPGAPRRPYPDATPNPSNVRYNDDSSDDESENRAVPNSLNRLTDLARVNRINQRNNSTIEILSSDEEGNNNVTPPRLDQPSTSSQRTSRHSFIKNIFFMKIKFFYIFFWGGFCQPKK